MNKIFKQLCNEDEAWKKLISKYIPRDSRLVSCSDSSAFRRVYEHNGVVFKFVKNDEPRALYENSVADEHQLLESLADSDLCPKPVSYHEDETCRVLALEKIIGEQIGQFGDEVCRHRVSVLQFLRGVLELNKRGIRHGDLTIGNIIFCADNRVRFLDFDQAVNAPTIGAILGDVFGIGQYRGKRSALRFSAQVVASRYRILGWIGRFVRGATRKTREPESGELVDSGEVASASNPLIDAWSLSSISDANAPGLNVSYYSLRLGDQVLPGERQWEPRWAHISAAVDFSGKRFLELGCNLSTLSAYAELVGGASNGLAVDHDAQIIGAAKSFSSAVGASTAHKICDFDRDPDWEDQILRTGHFDIVSALSVMQWLEHRDRFLRFLAGFEEILYEGHESICIEYNRLQSAGFKKISLVDVSERGRVVLYGRK